jgi:voltage-gated potassium channel
MSKRFPFALAQLMAATTARGVTKVSYVAITVGLVTLLVLSVDPAYRAGRPWIEAILWICAAFFIFEWMVRLQYALKTGRLAAYLTSTRGLVDTAAALAPPLAMALGVNSRSAWLFGVFWLLKLTPGIPGLRQLRRVLVLESGPLLSVLAIFLMVLLPPRWWFTCWSARCSRPGSAAFRPRCGGRSRP